MQSRISPWLTTLADPAGVNRTLPTHRLDEARWAELLVQAESHGVLPAVLANLKQLVREQGTGPLLDRCTESLEAKRQFDDRLAAAGAPMRQRTAASILLKQRSDEVRVAMARGGVPAMILKGCDFAERLYSHPGLRPYRDIDLLVPRDGVGDAEKVLVELGYRATGADPGKYQDEYGEASWHLIDHPWIVVELHWNLVNSPAQRRTVSIGYDDLQLESYEREGLTFHRPSPASILLMSAVHAAVGHRFDRLQLLCDICQSGRGVAGPIDEGWLRDNLPRTGGRRALGIALHLAGRSFDEPRCQELGDRIQLDRLGPSWRLLLGGSLVLQSATPINSLRRQVLREILKRAA